MVLLDFWKFNAFTIIWILFVLILVLMPGKEMPDTGAWLTFDKIAHFGVFCVLTILMIVGFSKQSRYPSMRNNAVKYTLFIGMAYGAILETTQLLAPGRIMSLADLIMNLSGCLAGYFIFILVYKFSFR